MEWDGINRRRCLRVKFPYTVHVHAVDRKVLSAYTEDISCGGVKIVIEEALFKSCEVDLEIYFKQDPLRCKGNVVWVTEKHNPLLGLW